MPLREPSVGVPAAPEVSPDREPRIFFIFFVLEAGPNLRGALWGCGNRTPTAAYEPFRRHSSRAVPADPAEAARAAGGCLVCRGLRPAIAATVVL